MERLQGQSQTRDVKPIPQKPELNRYINYRLYLNDYYDFMKKTSRGYSYAVFSARADIKSPNYLKLVIDGKRNLSESMIIKFARSLRLSKEQTKEFQALVRYNQATINEERNQHLKNLAELRVHQQIARGEIDQEVWENIPSWVSWILYEMVDQRGVRFEEKQMLELLRQRAKADEIQAAFKKLIEKGEIVFDEVSGEYKKARDVTKTRESIPVALVKKLQAELFNLGLESLYNDSPKDREFGALTMCLTREEFEQMKFELRQLRKRYHRDVAVARRTSKGERVYQFNIQLFPITDPVKDN